MYSFLSTKQDNENNNMDTSNQKKCDDSEEQKSKINIYLKLLYEAEVRRILNCHFIPLTVRRRYATLPACHRNQSLHEHRVLLRICDHFQQMNMVFTFLSTYLRHFFIPRLTVTSQQNNYIAFILPFLSKAEIFLRKYPFRHNFYERLLRHSIKRSIKEDIQDPHQILDEEMSLPLQIIWDFVKEEFSLFSMFLLENVELSDDSNTIEIRQMYDELQNQVPELEELFEQQQQSYNHKEYYEAEKKLNNDLKVLDSERNDLINESKLTKKENLGKIDDNGKNVNNNDKIPNNTENCKNGKNNIETNNVNVYHEEKEISTISDCEAFPIDLLSSDYLTLECLKKVGLLSACSYDILDFPHFIHQLIESSSSCGSSISSSFEKVDDD